MRKKLCRMILAMAMLVSCLGASASAAEMYPNEDASFAVMRASGRFSVEVPANTAVKAGSTFPLEVGEVVTIKATYSPFSASVDFGLIAPDGPVLWPEYQNWKLRQVY